MELSEQGQRLLNVLVLEIKSERFDVEHPENFLGYGETLGLLNLPADAPHGQTDGQTLQLNGLNDLARWIRKHPKRLPRITGLIVSKQQYDELDGTHRMPHVPGKGYFVEYGRNVEDWTWWLAESRKSLDFNWSPYLSVQETFDLEEIRHVGAVSEGAEREMPTKVRQRSQKLRDLAREHFSGKSPDKKLRCATCDWTKPNFPLAHEIIDIHHTEEMSSLPKTGRKLTLDEALALLTPLCPRCHRMLHAKPGGGCFTVEALRECLRKTST
jgi:hypothetical protein